MADASVPAEHAAGMHLLQAATPLEDSLLWRLQAAYYIQQGVLCWVENSVPSFVTSNAFVANAYARVVLAYLRDWYASGRADRTQPVYLVELGAGHGKLSFLLLRELMAAWQSWPDLGRDAEADVDTAVRPVSYSTALGSECAFVTGPGAEAPDALRPSRLTGVGASSFGHGPGGRRAPFRLVLTDFAPELLAFWASHESLAPYVEAGVVDFGLFNAERDTSIVLTHARGADGVAALQLSPGCLANPIVGVANYCFDTLTQAAFRVTPVGGLEQGLASLYTVNEEHAAALAEGASTDSAPAYPAGLIEGLRVVWTYRPIAVDGPEGVPISVACPDPQVAAVLRAYAALPSARAACTSFTVPVGGLNAMRRLSSLSRTSSSLVLAGDKAAAVEEELLSLGLRDPHVALHGSFSFMVNFHALRLLTLGRGPACASLHTPYVDGFKVAAFLWDGPVAGAAGPHAQPAGPTPARRKSGAQLWAASLAGPADGSTLDAAVWSPEALWAAAAVPLPSWTVATWPETTFTWADTMDTFGPEAFGTLQRCVRDEIPDPPLKLVLALLRMACWDPDVALKFKQTLIDKAPVASERLQADITRDVVAVYERYYPLSPAKDLAFELARVLMGMRRYHEAIALFVASTRHTGEHHVTLYNIGICCFHLGPLHFDGSRAAFTRALALKADYVDATTWKSRVEDAMLLGAKERQVEAAAAALRAGQALANEGAVPQGGEQQLVATPAFTPQPRVVDEAA
jgi:hypothetical protein